MNILFNGESDLIDLFDITNIRTNLKQNYRKLYSRNLLNVKEFNHFNFAYVFK